MVEEESGTSTWIHRHTHNGYYAGDFTDVPFLNPQDPRTPSSVTATRRPWQ